jgi:hypothetical protein
LHPIQYIRTLQPWANFKADVANTYNAQTWNQTIIATKLTGNLLAGQSMKSAFSYVTSAVYKAD